MASDFKQALPAGTILRGGTYSYRIRSVLGQGSFGITYLASTSMRGPLGEVAVPVAVKEFFASELDSRRPDGSVLSRTEGGVAHKYAKAFQRESLNLSGLKHPGIVNVLEAFEANGTYYYSMEYLPGGTLDAKVKGVGMPEKEALMMVSRIGEALSYLHDHKIMHLDLKPKNIMLKDDFHYRLGHAGVRSAGTGEPHLRQPLSAHTGYLRLGRDPVQDANGQDSARRDFDSQQEGFADSGSAGEGSLSRNGRCHPQSDGSAHGRPSAARGGFPVDAGRGEKKKKKRARRRDRKRDGTKVRT